MSTTTGTTGTTDPGDRPAAEIERDVEATRANLAGTLEELRDRASPGQLFEQAVDYARTSGGAEMVRNLGAAMRDNPLPLVLIGAGIGWLMLSGNGRGGSRYDRAPRLGETDPYSDPYDDRPSLAARASQAVGDAARGAAEATRRLSDSVTGAASRAGEAAGSAWRGTSDAAGSAASGVQQAAASGARRAADMGQGARTYADRMGHGARAYGESASEGLGWMAREQPLLLGAVGFALGAAVGALLPRTETEDRLMGETRDAALEQARLTAAEGYERVKDTAEEQAGRLREGGAGEHAGRAGEALGDAARAAREAVTHAAHELADQAKSGLGAADEGPRPAGTRTGTGGARPASGAGGLGAEPRPGGPAAEPRAGGASPGGLGAPPDPRRPGGV